VGACLGFGAQAEAGTPGSTSGWPGAPVGACLGLELSQSSVLTGKFAAMAGQPPAGKKPAGGRLRCGRANNHKSDADLSLRRRVIKAAAGLMGSIWYEPGSLPKAPQAIRVSRRPWQAKTFNSRHTRANAKGSQTLANGFGRRTGPQVDPGN